MPDGLWLMPRRVAAATLTSLEAFLSCPKDAAAECCQLQASGSHHDVLRFTTLRKKLPAMDRVNSTKRNNPWRVEDDVALFSEELDAVADAR